jgi:hypothetical protein
MDQFSTSGVTKQEISETSLKYKAPVFLIRNQNPNEFDLEQNEKDIARIKNDLAEYFIAGGDYTKYLRLFKVLIFPI